jgi:hypothetical protein
LGNLVHEEKEEMRNRGDSTMGVRVAVGGWGIEVGIVRSQLIVIVIEKVSLSSRF